MFGCLGVEVVGCLGVKMFACAVFGRGAVWRGGGWVFWLALPQLTVLAGQIGDRSSMRGQLNWIFIAVTDTIAWDVLSTDMFQRIFRNDLLAAALFRNFLLAVSGS